VESLKEELGQLQPRSESPDMKEACADLLAETEILSCREPTKEKNENFKP